FDPKASPRSGIVKAVCFSPDGGTLAVGANLEYMEWYPAPWNREQQIFRMVAKSADLVLFDVATQTRTHTLRQHRFPVIAVAFSPDGKTIATGSADKSLKLWDAAMSRDLMTLQEAPPHLIPLTRSKPLAFSPDSRILVTGNDNGTIQLWDRARGTNLATWPGHFITEQGKTRTWAILTVAFSPDGKTLASAGWDGCVRLWDVASRKNTMTLRGHADGDVNFVAFNSKGTLLAAGGWRRTKSSEARQLNHINLWHMPSGAEAALLSGPESEILNGIFTPNGESFVAVDRSAVFTWDLPASLVKAEK
ncbi:MAG: hypothetical protein JOZ55_01425, partial [Alphaproteobacteria bacterium]|nr:hypothetical protein [Alphaproteobacteria bacterium]